MKLLSTIVQSQYLTWYQKLYCIWYVVRTWMSVTSSLSLILTVPLTVWHSTGIVNSSINIYWAMICHIATIIFTWNEVHLFLLYAFFMSAMGLHHTFALISVFLNQEKANQWIVTPKFGVTAPITTASINLAQQRRTTYQYDHFLFQPIQWLYKVFQKHGRRIRLYKSYLVFGLHLLFISYLAGKRDMAILALYTMSVSVMCLNFAFGTLGRQT